MVSMMLFLERYAEQDGQVEERGVVISVRDAGISSLGFRAGNMQMGKFFCCLFCNLLRR